MAIGRVAGPMLLPSLDRQSIDLSFVSDPGTGTRTALYLDMTNFQIAVNTDIRSETLTINGNLSVGTLKIDTANITTKLPNQSISMYPNGTGQVIIGNANIIKGNINSTDIGTSIPSSAFFTTANTTAKATLASAQVKNLTPGRVVFSDGTGLSDDSHMVWFSGNSTFFATNLQSAGTVGYASVHITGALTYDVGATFQVPFFTTGNLLTTDTTLRYFTGNGILTTGNIRLAGQTQNQVLYVGPNNLATGTPYLTFDGINLTTDPTSTTTLAGIQFKQVGGVQQITTTGINQSLYISPNGVGFVSVNGHQIKDLANPTDPGDAVPYSVVQPLLSTSSATTLQSGETSVQVYQDPSYASVNVTVRGTRMGTFTESYTYLQNMFIQAATLGTTAGDLVLSPAYDGASGRFGRVVAGSNSALQVPVGGTSTRPLVPTLGDFRLNTDSGAIEWYDGARWDNAGGTGNNTVYSQTLSVPSAPNGITTDFSLSEATTTAGVLININGVLQQPDVAYSVSGSTITFNEAPLTTDVVEVRFLSGSVSYSTNPIIVAAQYGNIAKTSTSLVDSFYITQYRSAQYVFTAKNTATNQYQIGELYLIHNDPVGATASVTSTVKTAMGGNTNPIVTWSTNITGAGVVQLLALGFAPSGNVQVKLHRTYFGDL